MHYSLQLSPASNHKYNFKLFSRLPEERLWNMFDFYDPNFMCKLFANQPLEMTISITFPDIQKTGTIG